MGCLGVYLYDMRSAGFVDTISNFMEAIFVGFMGLDGMEG